MRRKKNVSINLGQLAQTLNAVLISPGRHDKIKVSGLATLDEAGRGDLSFVGSDKVLEKAGSCQAGAFLVSEKLVLENRPCIVVDNVWKAVIQAVDIWHPDQKQYTGIHPSAVVHESVETGEDVFIGPNTVIERDAAIGNRVEIGAQCFVGRDTKIGEGTILYPHVTLQERVVVGKNVIIHSGAVLGADGFKYEVIDGLPCKVPQVGTVVIEDEVEIGANTCIDRAFLGETRIGYGTKIDNLVQVGHNCRIGRYNAMAAGVGFSDSVTTGTGCIFWGQAGIKEQITIGDGAVINGQAGVKGDLPAGVQVFGSPAIPVREAARQQGALRRLPEVVRKIRRIEKKMEGL